MRHPNAQKTRLYTAVGRKLQRVREDAGLTLRALEALTEITASQLGSIENGSACPLHVIVKLADAYDLTLDDLVPVLTDGMHH